MKKGDKVRCIKTSPAGYFGVVGEEYTLAEDQTAHKELLLVEDSQKQWLSGDRFEQVTSTASTTNTFKVGDRVKVLDSYSGTGAGMEANVIKIHPIGTVSIRFDSGFEWLYYPSEVEHVKASLKVGDDVYYIGTDPYYQGIPGVVLSKGNNTSSVIFHSIGSRVVLFKNDELVKSVNLRTPVNLQTQAIRTGVGAYTNPVYFYGGGGSVGRSGTLNEVVGVTMQQAINSVNKSTCSHEYKIYTGLAKRYDYCTKCDHTKNERGIYD